MATRGRTAVGFECAVTVQPRHGLTGKAGATETPAPLHTDRWVSVTDDVKEIASEAVGNAGDRRAVLRRCYEFVVTHLRYGDPITGLYSAREAMQRSVVDCGGFSSLLCAMLIARGIPARIVSGFWAGYPAAAMHAWLEAECAPGQWISMDPSTDHLSRQGRTKKSGRFGYVGSDRIAFSVGSDITCLASGETVTVPILQHPVLTPSSEAVRMQARVTAERL